MTAPFQTPALIVDGLMKSTDDLLQFALKNEARYAPVLNVTDGLIPTAHANPDYQAGKLFDAQIKMLISPVLQYVKDNQIAIHEMFNIPKKTWRYIPTSIYVMGDGQSHAPHNDLHPISGPNLQFTFLFYFHSIPKRFSGGELVVYLKQGDQIIPPDNNRLVVIPGGYTHSVSPVHTTDEHFSSSRFVVVGRILVFPTTLMLISKVVSTVHRRYGHLFISTKH